MIFDANVFIGESLYGNSLMPDQLKSIMQANKVAKAIIRPLKPCNFDYDQANRYISEVQSKNKEFIGFGRIDPWVKDAAAQTRRAIKEYGLKGIHLHPWEENFSLTADVVSRVMDVVAAERVPVYISAGYPCVSEPLKVLNLAEKYPQVKIIVTHGCQLDMSGLSFDEALIVAEETSNVIFDISGVYRRDFIELLVEKAGQDRVVLGSCTPYMDMHLEIARVTSTLIPQEVKDRILATNIEKILE